MLPIIQKKLPTVCRKLLSKRLVCFSRKSGTFCKLHPDSSSLFFSNAYQGHSPHFTADLQLESKLLASVKEIRANVRRRKLNIDVDSIVSNYNTLLEMKPTKKELEERKSEISQQIAAAIKTGGIDSDIEKLKEEGLSVKKELKDLIPEWLTLEEYVVMNGLWLPNSLHPKTPDEPLVLASQIDLPAKTVDHVFVGQRDGLIKFSNIGRKAHYLFGEAAKLEFNLSHYISALLEREKFLPIAGPDLCRSPIVEGCTVNFDNPEESILLRGDSETHPKFNDAMYLTGASSPSLLAFFAKLRVCETCLPLRIYTKGSTYSPKPGDVTNDDGSPADKSIYSTPSEDDELTCSHIEASLGLYESLQSATLHALVISKDSKQSDAANETLVQQTRRLFSELVMPFRVVRVPAPRLRLSERSRVEFQVYSPIVGKFVTSAYVADVSDFVSRRLEILTDGGEYCHVSHGCVFDVTKAVASLIECRYDVNSKTFTLPTDVRHLQWNLH